MFRITRGCGFHITFENGYTISVQFGWGNYCEHHDEIEGFNPSIDPDAHDKKLASKGSRDAEIAIIDPSGELVEVEEWKDTVKGYCSPDEVLEWMNYAAKLPKEIKQ